MTNRRNFIKKSIVTGAGLMAAGAAVSACQNQETMNIPKGTQFLFQGDSITDGNRTRNNDWNHVLGHGYAFIIASRLWFEYPDKDWMFYNRGISGNTIDDLKDRWGEDAIDLNPDVLSILIGINDVYGIVKGYLEQSIAEFEKSYRAVLDKTKSELPSTTILLLEPFILPGGRVEENTEVWKKETQLRQKVVRKLSDEYQTLLVPLQEPFTKACEKAPAKHWIWDGIHPMPAGHELIAREWIKVVQNSKLNHQHA